MQKHVKNKINHIIKNINNLSESRNRRETETKQVRETRKQQQQ